MCVSEYMCVQYDLGLKPRQDTIFLLVFSLFSIFHLAFWVFQANEFRSLIIHMILCIGVSISHSIEINFAEWSSAGCPCRKDVSHFVSHSVSLSVCLSFYLSLCLPRGRFRLISQTSLCLISSVSSFIGAISKHTDTHTQREMKFE